MQQTSKDSDAGKLSRIRQDTVLKGYLEESEFLKKERAAAESLKIPIVDDETGIFLELACRLLKPSNILEIGCGTGYSTYFLLKSLLPELIAGKSVHDVCGAKSLFGGADKIIALESKVRDCKEIESDGHINKTLLPDGSKETETISSKANYSKKHFSYTGIDLNRERLRKACLFIGSLINKTLMPGFDGKRIKSVIECESSLCSLEFIHGDAVKIIRAADATEEKYDLVFIDAAKFQYPCYLEALKDKLGNGCAIIADNIFYGGKIFLEEKLKHDANSVDGLSLYLRMVTREDAFETSLFNAGDGIALSIYNKGK